MNLRQIKILALLLCVTFTTSAKEQKVTELNITIDTPAGFTTAERFSGFEQVESFTTIKMSEKMQSLATSIATHLKENETTLISQNVTISDKEGLLIKNPKTISGTDYEVWTLLFGDEISSASIIATFPTSLSKAMGPLIKKSLLSTRWAGMTKTQLFKGLPFILEKSGNLNYAKRTTNSIVLIDKTPYDLTRTVTPLLIYSHTTAPAPIEDIAVFSKQLLQKSAYFDEIEIVSQEVMSIAGVTANQIIANATEKNSGLPVTVYQVMSSQGQRYLLAQGIVGRDDAAGLLPQFKAVTDSVAFNKGAQK
jgi:hypothetical protein